MEIHLKALDHLCRVCESYISTKNFKSSCSVSSAAKETQPLWSINVWKDQTDQHPNKLCSNCKRKVYHFRSGTRQYQPNQTFKPRNWKKHSRTGNCETCSLYRDLVSGAKGDNRRFKNRPATTCGIQKLPKSQLPFETDKLDIFSHVHSIFTVRQSSNYYLDIDRERIHPDHQEFFICSLCLCILSNSVYTECQHSFCSDCLTRLFQFHRDIAVPCPVCRQSVSYHSVKEIPNFLHVQLQNLCVYCTKCNTKGNRNTLSDHQCPTVIHSTALGQNQQHVVQPQSQSTQRATTGILSPVSAAAETLNSLAKQHQPGQPIPEKIRQLTDKWTWLRLKASKDRSIQLKTRGMVIKIIFHFTFS